MPRASSYPCQEGSPKTNQDKPLSCLSNFLPGMKVLRRRDAKQCDEECKKTIELHGKKKALEMAIIPKKTKVKFFISLDASHT